jgi:hypothetical protein
LAETIDNPRVGPTIFGMTWSRVDLSKASIQLLTSDRPLDMPFGLAEPNTFIALSVSPRALFIAAHDSKIAREMGQLKPTEVVKKYNQRVIAQARKFVYGTSDSQLKFIERNFGKAPDRVILTDEQRQKAIDAARGKIGK